MWSKMERMSVWRVSAAVYDPPLLSVTHRWLRLDHTSLYSRSRVTRGDVTPHVVIWPESNINDGESFRGSITQLLAE